MDGKVLGIERRRRWSKDEKARIVEETLARGAVVSEVARRHGVAQSLLFTWRRLARTAEPTGRDGSILLPVEIDRRRRRPCWRRRDGRARRQAGGGRGPASSRSSLAPGTACASTATSTPRRFVGF